MKPAEHLGHNLGLNVSRLRREQNLTKTALSLMSGISRPFLNKIEDGESNPKLSYVEQIADALCVNPLELLCPMEEDRN